MSRPDFDYIAFISYRHKPLDRRTAIKIQKSIESFTLPRELRGGEGNKKLGRVFRDDDELPLSPDLSESILHALDRSKFLIVVCTPDLPLSKWCEQEIRYFLATHDRDHVLTVLADGTVLTEAVSGELSGRCWVNGQPVAESEENNGTGEWDLAGRLMISRQDGCFVTFDPLKGIKREIPDSLADLPETSLAQGSEKPVFACAYSDGEVFLFDPEDGAARATYGSYARSEIQALCFAENDRKLLVLTASGRIDLYDTGSGELTVSVQTEFENSLSGMTEMQCKADQERHRLHICAGKQGSNTGTWICLDTDAWIVTASEEYTNGWFSGDNCLYRICNGSLTRCPVYSLEELKAWAEESVQ